MGDTPIDPTSPGSVAAGLRSLLADARRSEAPVGRAIRPEVLEGIRAELDAAAGRAVELLQGTVDEADLGAVLPLRLPKSRVVALGGCERHALATERRTHGHLEEMSPRMLAGRALDVFVEHEIHGGPVGDPQEDLLSWLDARGEFDLRDRVIAAGEDLDLAPLASAARAWAGIEPQWWPRTQAVAAVYLADGAVRCEGRTDVELGGRLAGRPTVVVEVKAGRPHSGHLAEVTHYALLVALRDREAPALVARWYPGGVPAGLTVTEEVLRSASRRLADAIGAWVELQVGRPPSEVPGPACGWCPDADVCPAFEPAPDPYGGDG